MKKILIGEGGVKTIIRIFIINFLFYGFLLCDQTTIVQISSPKCGTMFLREIIRNIITLKSGADFNNTINARLFLQPKHFAHRQGEYKLLVTHLVHCDYNVNFLKLFSKVKTIALFRDPRDQAVSFAYFIKKLSNVWPVESRYSINDLIIDQICTGNTHQGWQLNLPPEGCDPVWPKGVDQMYRLVMPWMSCPDVYVTWFERLVGPHGGGNLDLQIQEIINIGRHIGLELTPDEARIVGERSFGSEKSQHSFRKGQIGSWKEEFTDEHKQLFKKHAGQLLIDLGYEKDFNW